MDKPVETTGTTANLFSKEEAADQLKCSVMTIHRQIKAGKLGHYRIASRVLISQRHIEEFLNRSERKPRKSA